MKGLAKGQSGLVTAVIALTIAVPLSSIPDFTVKYVTTSAFNDMEINSMRYQSAAHSYKFTSQGINNKINYSRVESDVIAAPAGSDECELDPSEFAPDEYNVTFDIIPGGVATFDAKGCEARPKYVASNEIYPSLPFFETEESAVNRIITSVVP